MDPASSSPLLRHESGIAPEEIKTNYISNPVLRPNFKQPQFHPVTEEERNNFKWDMLKIFGVSISSQLAYAGLFTAIFAGLAPPVALAIGIASIALFVAATVIARILDCDHPMIRYSPALTPIVGLFYAIHEFHHEWTCLFRQKIQPVKQPLLEFKNEFQGNIFDEHNIENILFNFHANNNVR